MTNPDHIGLSSPLLDALGGKSAKALADAFGIVTVRDLLMHQPRRYVPRGELTALGELAQDDQATVVARVKSTSTRRFRNKKGVVVDVVVTDGESNLSLTFFNQPWRDKQLQPGRVGLFGGKVGTYRGKRQLVNPDCLMLPDDTDTNGDTDPEAIAAFAKPLIPVYRATAGVPSWRVANCVRTVLTQVRWAQEPDPIPVDVRDRYRILTAAPAFEAVHRPDSWAQVERGRNRLRWEEAFAMQAALALRRLSLRAQPAAPRHRVLGGLVDQLDARLPFELTDGQKSVGETIFTELGSQHPMHRLLQGDVGSGKTVVALRAMLVVLDAGGQAALLAPTEVLAAQHYRSIRGLLGPMAERGMFTGSDDATDVVLLTGSMSVAERRDALLKVFTGQAGIVIGTHALLQDKVVFSDLALVVVDEQHRFGVEQRAALADKAADGMRPHVLVMTATPIPRTVAITVFGDLDLSMLTDMPAGRTPIETFVVPTVEKPQYLARAWERVREEVANGHQVYVVCPRISADDPVDPDLFNAPTETTAATAAATSAAATSMKSIEDVLPYLMNGPLAGLRLAPLHGRMSADEKETTMRRFVDGPDATEAIDVLVATTVIEVGVDVPTATTMVIMDADRFGISQLHQLRGRVGRGGLHGLCLLVTDGPDDSPARERLDAVSETTDGFALSLTDLKLRREGDVLGGAQSGRRSSLRALSLLRDGEIISAARKEATAVVEADPTLGRSTNAALREAVDQLIGSDGADWLERS